MKTKTHSCIHKARFQTRREARDIASAYYEAFGIARRVYGCKSCNGFHLIKGKTHVAAAE